MNMNIFNDNREANETATPLPRTPPANPQSTLYTIAVFSFELSMFIIHIIILALYFDSKQCLTVSTWLIINCIRISLMVPHAPLKWYSDR